MVDSKIANGQKLRTSQMRMQGSLARCPSSIQRKCMAEVKPAIALRSLVCITVGTAIRARISVAGSVALRGANFLGKLVRFRHVFGEFRQVTK